MCALRRDCLTHLTDPKLSGGICQHEVLDALKSIFKICSHQVLALTLSLSLWISLEPIGILGLAKLMLAVNSTVEIRVILPSSNTRNRSVADPGFPKAVGSNLLFWPFFLKLDENLWNTAKKRQTSQTIRCSILVDKVKVKYVFQQFCLRKRLQNKLKWHSEIVIKGESRIGYSRHYSSF